VEVMVVVKLTSPIHILSLLLSSYYVIEVQNRIYFSIVRDREWLNQRSI
jgi:hypothetical protein